MSPTGQLRVSADNMKPLVRTSWMSTVLLPGGAVRRWWRPGGTLPYSPGPREAASPRLPQLPPTALYPGHSPLSRQAGPPVRLVRRVHRRFSTVPGRECEPGTLPQGHHSPRSPRRTGAGGCRSGDPLRLVLDLEGYLLELVGVLLAVVRAEEKLETAGEGDSDVGLRAATITTICRAEGGALDDGRAHGRPLFRKVLLSDEISSGARSTAPRYT